MDKIEGVGVDKGAVSLHDPVTVVITAGGHEMDADDWSHANNLVATGARVKPGCPRFPGDEDGAPEPPKGDEDGDIAPEKTDDDKPTAGADGGAGRRAPRRADRETGGEAIASTGEHA